MRVISVAGSISGEHRTTHSSLSIVRAGLLALQLRDGHNKRKCTSLPVGVIGGTFVEQVLRCFQGVEHDHWGPKHVQVYDIRVY